MKLFSYPNMTCLFICQTLFIITISVDLTYTGLAGFQLASNKDFATLPYALITLATALTTLFVALLMQYLGRKKAFLVGAVFAILSGLTTYTAIRHNNFAAFAMGTAFVGIFQAFSQYYRLAAADFVETQEKHKAISAILLAGVIGVFIGPTIFNLFIQGNDLHSINTAYLTTMFMGILVFLMILFFYHEDVDQRESKKTEQEQVPFIRKALIQPIYITAVTTNAIGYAIMMFVMTATPIAMMKAHHDIHYSTSVIQLHMIGMFATSFFTGKIISSLGEINVILMGIVLNVICAVMMIFFNSVPAFFIALFCLGTGWNFMFISGSSLLVRSYRPEHRYIMQSISEFTTFSFSAIGALSAGWILNTYSWVTINICILPLLIIPIISIGYYEYNTRYGQQNL